MRTLLLVLSMLAAPAAPAAVRSVGPGQPYAKPCQAFAAAQDGDVIEIDASGNYDGDVCVIYRNNLTIRGVNGRARIDAAGKYAQGKGIWVVAGDNIVVENIEFSGARVPDRNGAEIRPGNGDLTFLNCVWQKIKSEFLEDFVEKCGSDRECSKTTVAAMGSAATFISTPPESQSARQSDGEPATARPPWTPTSQDPPGTKAFPLLSSAAARRPARRSPFRPIPARSRSPQRSRSVCGPCWPSRRGSRDRRRRCVPAGGSPLLSSSRRPRRLPACSSGSRPAARAPLNCPPRR